MSADMTFHHPVVLHVEEMWLSVCRRWYHVQQKMWSLPPADNMDVDVVMLA
jgi:hypothetical protein